MAWTLGLDELRGPGKEEEVGTERPSSGESVYYGPPQNGTRREWGTPPLNGRDQPWVYPVQTGIGGRSVTQPVLNGVTRLPWHIARNGTTNALGIANPNGFTRPLGLSPGQFERGRSDGN
jgi:hypothetical protein